jgi:hypothetical protein
LFFSTGITGVHLFENLHARECHYGHDYNYNPEYRRIDYAEREQGQVKDHDDYRNDADGFLDVLIVHDVMKNKGFL